MSELPAAFAQLRGWRQVVEQLSFVTGSNGNLDFLVCVTEQSGYRLWSVCPIQGVICLNEVCRTQCCPCLNSACRNKHLCLQQMSASMSAMLTHMLCARYVCSTFDSTAISMLTGLQNLRSIKACIYSLCVTAVFAFCTSAMPPSSHNLPTTPAEHTAMC